MAIPPDWRWKISYTTARDQDRGRPKSYDGTLLFWKVKEWLLLMNAKSAPLVGRAIKEGEWIKDGSEVKFPNHRVSVLSCIASPTGDMAEMARGLNSSLTQTTPSMMEVGSTSLALVMTQQEIGNDVPSSSVHDALALGLDFSPGLAFARKARSEFYTTVHPARNSLHFTMVVSFGRSTFRLSEDNVSLALESVIGGLCDELKVSILRDRVFSFTVSCKQIGFMILQRRSFSCAQFKCYFHLWGRGGPNWGREFDAWQKECQQEWTLVSPSKRVVQLGLNAMREAGKPKSAIRSNSLARKKLQFTTIENYPACRGYRYPVSAEQIQDLQQGGYVLTEAEKIPAPPTPMIHWTAAEPRIQFGTTATWNIVKPLVPILHSTRAEPCIQFSTKHPIEQVSGKTSASDHVQSSVEQAPSSDLNSGFDSQLGQDIPSGPELSADGLKEFEKMIDDMVYKVWECGRCLRMGHNSKDCVNDIRCRACFSYGHIAKQCLNKQGNKSYVWVPKRASGDAGLLDSRKSHALSSSDDSPKSTLKQSAQATLPPPTCSPQDPPPAEENLPMAVFEIDPTPWLPLGHQIIDGGPTCLPRAYYTPAVPPPCRHDNYCVAHIELPQPGGDGFWRDQVRDFVQENLGLDVMDCQPSLFGVGLLEMRSSATRQILVQHPLRQIDEGVFVRFVNHDESGNHRGVQGFRRGWLMFLGIHQDFRNDFDISNVVASFGKFIDWHRHDPLKEITLVYAAFPSPQTVPRDVVFGDYATIGGSRQGWTAPCYVLTADFADVVPADEDPMPMDGNPHPLPGNLQAMMNNFVLPPFPELG
ncbi:hypothetical protein ACQ4PT_032653 [Festuca glaucescens]